MNMHNENPSFHSVGYWYTGRFRQLMGISRLRTFVCVSVRFQ